MLKEIQLELTNRCNSNCEMCVRDEMTRPIGNMSVKMAKGIIKESYKLGARLLKPQFLGESLLYKDFEEVISYAKEKEMRIVMTTNGSLLKPYLNFIVNNVDKIWISIDNEDKKKYERIRKGLKFEDVSENLKALWEKKKELKSSIEMLISVVRTDINIVNEEKFRNKFSQYCDHIKIHNESLHREWDGIDRKIVCPHFVNERLVFGFDGTAYICCHDLLGKYKIGDYKKECISNIWNSKQRKEILQNLKNLKICRQCMQSLGE